jgi:GxxExxY protein
MHQGSERIAAAHQPIPRETEATASLVVDSAFRVHSILGPGLLESVYEACLRHELAKRATTVRQQVALPIIYDDLILDGALRLDLLVNDAVVVEIKAVETITPVHAAQVLTYLRLSGHRLGLLINFNVVRIRDGLKRFVL